MSLTLDLRKATKNITEKTEKVVRGTIIGVSSRIIKATPVANPALWKKPRKHIGGTLRGAWNASIGAPDMTKTDKIDTNGAQTVAAASAVSANLEIGQTYYLTNPQPYAYPVEYGWSSQAPQGMVRLGVLATQTEINKLT